MLFILEIKSKERKYRAGDVQIFFFILITFTAFLELCQFCRPRSVLIVCTNTHTHLYIFYVCAFIGYACFYPVVWPGLTFFNVDFKEPHTKFTFKFDVI